MRRAIILAAMGLIAIVSAVLYVYSGASHEMVWTYQDCVARVAENCAARSPFAVHCNHVGFICTRYEPRLQQSVYNWLIETAVVAACVLVLFPLTPKPVVTRP